MNTELKHVIVTIAGSADLGPLRRLLSREGLPANDLGAAPSVFFVIREEEKLIAAIGLETQGSDGLLRSMVVEPRYRNRGLASDLLTHLLTHARAAGLNRIFLLTETAEAWFSKKGFVTIARSDAPEGIRGSTEFSQACPSSASLMKFELSHKAAIA